MSISAMYGSGLLATIAFAFAVVAYIRAPLRELLVELCGTERRADFWLAISVVCMAILPLLFAMNYTPEAALGAAPALQIAAQFKWGLAGLLLAVIVIAFVLSSFISRHISVPSAATSNAPAERNA